MPYFLIFIGLIGISLSIIGLNTPYIQYIDVAAVEWMDSHRNHFLNEINVFLSHIGSLLSMLVVCVLCSLKLYQSQKFAQILFINFSLIGSAMIAWLIKWLFDRARPDAVYALTETYGASFPSAHTVYATVLSCLIIFIFYKHNYARYIIFLACIWCIGMGLSRVYLGAHFPTDVVAGWGVALFWVALMRLQFYKPKSSKNKLFLDKNLNEVE